MRKLGISVFVIGALAITVALGFVVRTYFFRNPDGRVGKPPADRGFVLDIGIDQQPPAAFAAAFSEMHNAHATAILFIGGLSRPDFPTLLADARAAKLSPWFAVPPLDDPAAYSATALDAAQFCAANQITHFVLGLHVPFLLDEKPDNKPTYWTDLIASLRAAAPGIQITLVAEKSDYLWFPHWSAADILGVTGDFDMPMDKAKDSFFFADWSTHVSEVISTATTIAGKSNGRPYGTAFIDIAIPDTYSFETADTFLRTLIHQSKLQPPTDNKESTPQSRPPLNALFISGWKLDQVKGLREHIGLFQTDWRENAPLAPVSLPVPASTPASAAKSIATSTSRTAASTRTK